MKQTLIRSVLVMMLILSFVLAPMSVAAAANTKAVYEVVLLVDSSGSMQTSDPNQLAYDALKTFAAMYPTQSDMYISVIAFNDNAQTVIKRANVSNAADMEKYMRAVSDQMPIRLYGTNTGAAMRAAREVLDVSGADKKAVVLFTDGRTEVNVGGSMTTSESIRLARQTAEYFGQAGVPVFCAGLDEEGTKIDENALQELANLSNGQYLRCHTASEINKLFVEIFARFMGVEDDAEELPIQPDVDTQYTADIYGQAIMEANINLFSDAAISSFRVNNPSGVCVASYNASTGELKADSNVCEVVKSDSDYVFNVKLKHPVDGNWTVTMRGKSRGTVVVSKVQLYNIDIVSSLSDKLLANTATTLDLRLFNNDTQKYITTKRIYQQSRCTVQIKNASGAVVSSGTAQLNASSGGYSYGLNITKEGRYQLVCTIANENNQFNLEKVIPFEVTKEVAQLTSSNVKLELPVTRCYMGESYQVKVSLTDPATGAKLSTVPALFADHTFKLSVRRGSETVDTMTFRVSDYKNGAFTAEFLATKSGDYEFSVEAYNKANQSVGSVSGGSQKLVVDSCSVAIELPSNPDFYNGEEATAIFKDADGKVLTQLPNGFANAKLQIELYCGDERCSVTTLDMSLFRDGQCVFPFAVSKKGDYSFRCSLLVDGKTISCGNTSVRVPDEVLYTPEVSIPTANIAFGGELSMTVSIKDLDGKDISKLPDRYADVAVEIFVMKGQEVVKTYTLGASDFANGKKTIVHANAETGTYSVVAKLGRAGKSVASTPVTASVADEIYIPVLTVPNGDLTCAGGATITVGLKNNAGTVIQTVSERYAGMKLTVKIMRDGVEQMSKIAYAKDIVNGKISYNFHPEASGTYTVTVALTLGDSTETAPAATLVFPASEITVSDSVSIPSVKESNTSGVANRDFDISGLFTDSDGDTLTYTAEADDPENVEVVIEGTTVQIRVKGFTKSHVVITAHDPYGATATYSVSVQVKSTLPLIIVLCVLGACLIVGLGVALVIIQKRKIINVTFDVKIEDTDSGEYVVYNVLRLARQRNAKPKMRLSDILNMDSVASITAGDLAFGDAADAFMAEAAKLEMTGLVNRKGFTVKTPKRKITYRKRQTSVVVGGFAFFFANPGSFDD